MKTRSDRIFAYPTESFYALGADATDSRAIKQLFRMKHRETGKPIALIAADLKQVKRFFYLSAAELRLTKKYWPPFGAAQGRGALTILLRPKKAIATRALLGTTPSRQSARHPSLTTPSPLLSKEGVGGGRIGVRVPAHTGARRLAQRVGGPITATSANLSGQTPTKSAIRVKQQFPDIMMLPGKCGRSIKPSTIIMVIKGQIKILRPGATILN